MFSGARQPQNSRLSSKKYQDLIILKKFIYSQISCDLVSFLYGYTLPNFNIKLHEKVILNLKKQFNSIKECVSVYKQLREDDAIALVYDFIEEVKKIANQANSAVKMEGLPGLLNNNLSEMVKNKQYVYKKWERQARLQAEAQLNQQYIIKILEEEENQRRKQAKEAEQKGWQCPVCMVEIDPNFMGILECSHIFHPQCLNAYLKAQIQTNNVEIRCPMQGCGKFMQTVDIFNYIDGDLRQKFQKFSFNKFVEGNFASFSWCPTAGCSAVFEFDAALNNYRCPACNKHYCLKCRCQYHVGMTCAEYRVNNSFDKNDEKFIDFVKGAKFKQCPKCKYWVERNDGCSTMKCKCGQEFCYSCGGTGCPHGSCSNSGGKGGGGGLLNRFFG